jgi:arylsulfatase A-like enzyme
MPSVVRLPHQCDRTWTALRTRETKLVLNADASPWLLFDLRKDPGELNNLVGTPGQEARVATLQALAQ